MSLASEVRTRLRALFRRASMERDLDEEMRYHLAREAERLQAAGVPADEARRRARATFGGVEAVREATRDERGTQWLEDLWRDMRRGVRNLARRPLYWSTASVTLGLGIAATTAIFSIVSYLMLRPLPARDPGQLVVFGSRSVTDPMPDGQLSLPIVREIRGLTGTFSDVAAYSLEVIGLREAGREGTVSFAIHATTGNFFSLLGLSAATGRLYAPADEDRREPVIVLSYNTWQHRFSGDPRIVGRTLYLNGTAFTVIGVAPKGFLGPEHLIDTGGFVPLALLETTGTRTAAQMQSWTSTFLRTIGRLAPGQDLASARAALGVLSQRIAPELKRDPAKWSVITEWEVRSRPVLAVADFVPRIAGIFLGLALLALCIACVNVGNLVLSRTMARSGELAVRRALGASRSRVARELLAESLVLALGALVVAIPVAWLVVGWLSTLDLSADLPIHIDVRLDRTVLFFATASALVAGLVAGVVPALRGSARDPGHELSSQRTTATRSRRAVGNLLLAGQLALSLVLVITGTLFLRSLASVTSLDLGLSPERVVMAMVDLSLSQYRGPEALAFYRRAQERLAALPGVTSVGMMRDVPMGYNINWRNIEHVDGREIAGERSMGANWNTLTPGAFETLKLHLISGRAFTDADQAGAPPSAIVNDVLARQLWPELQDATGQRFRMSGDTTTLEVVGVVRRLISEFPSESPVPQFFRPYAQAPSLAQALFVKVDGDPSLQVAAVRRTLRELEPQVAISELRAMEAFLHNGKAFFLYRIAAALTMAIGLMGLLQTLVGLYGVIAHLVGQRTREFGIRLALGASPGGLVRQVVLPAARYVALGVGLGLVGAAVALPLAGNVLAVSPREPLTYAACAGALTLLATVAVWLPARRAARAGPMRALRAE